MAGLVLWTALCAAGADRKVLAIGAHAGDMEVTCGAALIRQHDRGDHIVLLHLTLGEGGNPRMSARQYGAQKRREALEAAREMGAEVLFGPYHDGELPDTEETRRYVAGVIRQVQPALIVTHWRHSLHRDHATTHAVVRDAVLLASLAGYRGVRGVYYAENWEDAEEFHPYVFLDVTDAMENWRRAVSRYEFIRGGISSFPYLEYYTALAVVRGAESGRRRAEAFEVEPEAKKRVVDGW